MKKREVSRSLRLFASEQELADSCRRLRSHLRQRELAAESEIAAFWPDDEPVDLWTWVFRYGQLLRLKGVSSGGGGAKPGKRADMDAAAELAAVAALSDKPVPVATSGGTVNVHPKGIHALLWLQDQDEWLDWLCDRRSALEAIQASGKAEAPVSEMIAEVARAQVVILAEIAAQACSPGPAFRAEYPAGFRARFESFSPVDLWQIHRAYWEVNALRIYAAKRLAPRTAGEKAHRFTWGGLIAGVAARERRPPAEIADGRSLASLMVGIELGSAAAREAEAEDLLGR